MQNNHVEQFGNIDIYLFDQLLKGRFDNCTRILDAGCGGGRNIVYFLRSGFEVHGVDKSAEAIERVKALSAKLAPQADAGNFTVNGVEDIMFEDNYFNLVICSAVLHFAESPEHFDAMVQGLWRVLKTGGFLFARLASDIGIEQLVNPLGDGRYLLPDGSQRFLVNEQMLLDYTANLGGELFEPIKTTNVQNLRCMTTWCLKKL